MTNTILFPEPIPVSDTGNTRLALLNSILRSVHAGNCCRVLGPRYMGKSELMKACADRLRAEGTFCVSYQSIEAIKSGGWKNFFTRLYHRIEVDLSNSFAVPLDFEPDRPIDFQNALVRLVKQCNHQVVVLVDDLELAPPNLVASLLGALRAIFITLLNQSHSRFQAIVCGSLSFSQLALPRVSRFESISDLIMVGDLSVEESRNLVIHLFNENGITVNIAGLEDTLQYVSGDPRLIYPFVDACIKEVRRMSKEEISSTVVTSALHRYLESPPASRIEEALRLIESDPILLSCTARILEEGQVSMSELPLPSLEMPTLLDLSGLFYRDGVIYRIKCDLWNRLLQNHLTDERLGRQYALAGYWQQAIKHLGIALCNHQVDVSRNLFDVTIQAIHSSENGSDAFAYLAQGLQAIYFNCHLQVYARHAASLREVYPQNRDEILLSETGRPEVEALYGPDYSMVFDPNPTLSPSGMRYLFPLRRRSDAPAQGIVSLCEPGVDEPIQRHREEILQLIGFLRQATRGIEERESYTHRLAEAKALTESQINLNVILTTILHNYELPTETILRLVMCGVTAGICLGYNRAILFYYDLAAQALVAQIGVGHLNRREADRDWKEFPHMDINGLIKALLVESYRYTALHSVVKWNTSKGKLSKALTILATPDEKNLLAQAYHRNEVIVSRKPIYLEGLPLSLLHRIGDVEQFAILPFQGHDKVNGVLYIDNRFTWNEITEERLILLRSFINQSALVMEIAQALKEEQRQTQVKSQLLKAEERMSQKVTHSIKLLLEEVANSASQLFIADSAVLYTLAPRQEKGRTVFVTGDIVYIGKLLADHSSDDMPRSDQGMAKVVIREGLVKVDNMYKSRSAIAALARKSKFVIREGIQAMAAVRLGPLDRPEAVLFLNWRNPHLFNSEDITLLRLFANYAAVTIPSAHSYQQVQQELEGLSQIIQAGLALWSEDGIQAVVRQALDTTQDLTGAIQLSLVRRGPLNSWERYRFTPPGNLIFEKYRLDDARIEHAFNRQNPERYLTAPGPSLLWPIWIDRNLLAVIMLEGTHPHVVEKHQGYLAQMANRLALTFLQAEMYQALSRLIQLVLKLTQEISLEEFIEQLELEAIEAFHTVEAITCFYRDPETGHIAVGPMVGVTNIAEVHISITGKVGLETEVINLREPIFEPDVANNSLLNRSFAAREGIISAAALPLREGGIRVGSMFFNYRYHHEFNPAEKNLLQLFAHLTAIAIQRSRLQAEARHRQQNFETVRHITRLVAEAAADLNAIYQTVLREVLQTVPLANNACIVEKDWARDEYYIAPASLTFYKIQLLNNQGTYRWIKTGRRGIAGRVIEEGQPALINRVKTDLDYIPAISTTQSQICVPIKVEDRCEAALLLESDLPDQFTSDDLELLQTLADNISQAIYHARQFQREHQRAEREHFVKLATGLVHEFRRLVASIPGLVNETIRKTQQGIDATASLEDLRAIALDAGELLPRLRKVMIENKDLELQLQPLEPVIYNAIQQVKKDQLENIHIETSLFSKIPELVIDSFWIEALLRNLLENALESFARNQKGLIVVSTEIMPDRVIISIRDNGRGILSSNSSTKEKYIDSTKDVENTIHGFGLVLCHQVAEIHNGGIDINSTPGNGTLVSVWLPRPRSKGRL